MSDLAFPVLKSSNWKLSRVPQWKTQIATSSSGVRTRNLLQTSPVWKWTLKNGILQAADTVGDLQAIQNLFIQMYGRWDFFLWTDPEGASLVDPTIALGSNPTFPVCFTHDTVDFDRFAYQLWECGELEFEQVGVPTTSGSGGSTPPPITSTSKLYIVSAHNITPGTGASFPGIYQLAGGTGSDGQSTIVNGWGAGGAQWDTKTDSMNVGSGSYSITFGFNTVSAFLTNAINQLLIYEVYIQQTDSSGNVISTLRPSSATIMGTNTAFNFVQNPGNAIDGNTGTYALIYSDTTHELAGPPSLQITF